MDYRHLKFYFQSNWLKTLYFNFRVLPFRQAIHFPVLFFGKCDVYCGKSAKLILPDKTSTGMLLIGNNNSYSMGGINTRPEHTYFSLNGTLLLKGSRIFIGNGSRVYIRENALLSLAERVYISNRAKIHCAKQIEIGDLTRLSWECQIFDTNMHYCIDEVGGVKNCKGNVFIGKRCWIGNRCTIQKGTILNDESIVASNSLVNKDFSEIEHGTFAGMPAKCVKKGFRRIFSPAFTPQLDEYFYENPDGTVIINMEEYMKRDYNL